MSIELKSAQARIAENIARAKQGYEYRATPRKLTDRELEEMRMAMNVPDFRLHPAAYNNWDSLYPTMGQQVASNIQSQGMWGW